MGQFVSQMPQIQSLAEALVDAGKFFDRRGWVPATGGNFSARASVDHLLITASGVHKGELSPQDLLLADCQGKPLEPGRRASYETGLHVQLYGFDAAIGSVLHVHTVANTVLSRAVDKIELSRYELLKLLPGNPDPESKVTIPVFGNDQDIVRLGREVDHHLRQHPETPAYLIAGHGLYAWGDNVAQARYRVEALEFMFECELWNRRFG